MKTKIILLYILTFSIVLACVPSSGTDDDPIVENVLIDGIAIIETNDNKIPFIFHHKDGRNASILDDNENGSYDGIVYKDKEHSAVINFDEKTYLPTKVATSEGEIILFNYHSENTLLNIAILKGENIDYLFDIEVDVSTLNELVSKKSTNKFAKKPSAFEIIQKISTIISIVTGAVACEAAILTTAATVGLSAPSVLYACGSFAVTLATVIIDATEIEVENNLYQGSGLIALGLDFISCKEKINIKNCISAVVGSIEKIKALIENLTSSNTKEDIDKATGVIEVGETSNTLTLIGELNFKDIKVGESDERFFTIRNNSNKEVLVSKIDSPEGYFLNWSSGKIPAKKSQLIGVVFSPLKVQDYKGNIIVNNDLDNENNVIEVFGYGVIGIDNTINLVGSLEFNEVSIGSSKSMFFDIENHSASQDMDVSSIEFIGVLVDNFKIAEWSSGTIVAGAKQEVEVVFTPTEVTTYSGTIKVINTLDGVNNTMPISGVGEQATNVMKLIGNLDFGNVSVGTTSTKTFVIENHSLNDNISVSNIELPDGYSANWTSGEILPSAYQEVEILFSPTEEKDYIGVAVVINNLDEINNVIDVSGSSIAQGNYSDNYFTYYDIPYEIEEYYTYFEDIGYHEYTKTHGYQFGLFSAGVAVAFAFTSLENNKIEGDYEYTKLYTTRGYNDSSIYTFGFGNTSFDNEITSGKLTITDVGSGYFKIVFNGATESGGVVTINSTQFLTIVNEDEIECELLIGQINDEYDIYIQEINDSILLSGEEKIILIEQTNDEREEALYDAQLDCE